MERDIINQLVEWKNSSDRKPLLLTHIVINGVEKNDAFVNVIIQTSIYKFSLYGYSWEINSDNLVKITA